MRRLKKSSNSLLLLLVVFFLLNQGCATGPKTLVRELRQPTPENFISAPEKVKVHMKDGSLYMLDSLYIYENSDTIAGFGMYYNQYRDYLQANTNSSGIITGNAFKIVLPDVALLEVNELKNVKGKALALALVTAASIGITTYCLINPKACFGSCPTFYSWNGNDTMLIAEGFSSSILSIYEKDDIDMLYSTVAKDNNLKIRLKNEALETHVIRYANIMAVPRNGAERVFATETGDFYQTIKIQSPAVCRSTEGDCLDKIMWMDKLERYSASDPDNLAAREFIEMTFKNIPEGELGFIIGCRQTLMTTYLFYQTLAYLGSSAGHIAARIESGDKTLQRKFDNIKDLLGGIEIYIQNKSGRWIKINQVEENGPIASDVHLICLPKTGTKDLNIRLRLTKGLWRIDYLALCRIEQQIEPILVEPSLVIAKNGTNEDGASLLKNYQDPLITLPGDVYDLYYSLPDPSSEYELFLSTRGYYIEWMREPWLEEENHLKAAMLFGFPRLYLKKAAGDFKKVENKMEESFWNSKYVKKN